MEAVFCTIYILWLETEPRMHFGEDNYALPCPLLIGYESCISSNYHHYALLCANHSCLHSDSEGNGRFIENCVSQNCEKMLYT